MTRVQKKLKSIPGEKYVEYVTDTILDVALIVLDFIVSPVLVPIRIAKTFIIKFIRANVVRNIHDKTKLHAKSLYTKKRDAEKCGKQNV